ncbi:MAG: protein kinase, partial [Planctomycetes bacterium]|nr:protein kinase [Planctomycetota bacterium]
MVNPDPDRLQKLRELFSAVRDLAPEAREAELRARTAGDTALVDEVLALLACDEDSAAVRDRFDVAAVAAFPADQLGDQLVEQLVGGTSWQSFLAGLRRVGPDYRRYLVTGEVGAGGQGQILRVEDTVTRRALALKRIRDRDGAADAAARPVDDATLGRFLDEALFQAQLDHPAIVPVHEIGLDDRDRVYFTMKLVRGESLKAGLARVAAGEHGWTVERVLHLLVRVCEAMAYAHDKRIVHRDLKPANVMIGRFGEVFVMDWGLARSLQMPDRRDLRVQPEAAVSKVVGARAQKATETPEEALVTMDGAILGTPWYMPPEQAAGRIDEVGPPADVYSVGAMLYELLAGLPPYGRAGTHMTARTVLDLVLQGPPRPLVAGARVPAALVAIVDKAMARDPKQRYATMIALADDLRAFLDDRVVQAFAIGTWPELKSFVRRNRAVVVTVAAALVVATGLGGGWLWREQHNAGVTAQVASMREQEQREHAASLQESLQQAQSLAERNADLAYAFRIREAQRGLEAGMLEDARRALQDCEPGRRGFEWHHLQLRLDPATSRTPLLGYRAFGQVSLSDDGRFVAFETDTGIAVVDRSTGTRKAFALQVGSGRFLSGDGHRLIGYRENDGNHWLVVLDRESGAELQRRRVDGPAALTTASRTAQVVMYGGHFGTVTLLDFASATERSWSAPSGASSFRTLTIAADGSRAAMLMAPWQADPEPEPASVWWWDAASPEPIRLECRAPKAIGFSPAGDQLAILDSGSVRIWDRGSRAFAATVTAVAEGAEVVTFAGSTGRIVTAGPRQVRVSLAGAPDQASRIHAIIQTRTLHCGAESGTVLAVPGGGHELVEWPQDFDDGLLPLTAPVEAFTVGCSPAGTRGAVAAIRQRGASVGDPPAAVLMIDGEDGLPVRVFPGDTFAFSADGSRLAVGASADDAIVGIDSAALSTSRITLYDLDGGAEVDLGDATWGVNALAFRPDGRQLAAALGATRDTPGRLFAGGRSSLRVRVPEEACAGSIGSCVRIWDANGNRLATASPHSRLVTCLGYHPDGSRVYTGGQDGRVFELAADDLTVRREFVGECSDPVWSLAVDPRGESVAVGTWSGRLLLIDIASGYIAREFMHDPMRVQSLAWSPSGDRLAAVVGNQLQLRHRTGELLLDRAGVGSSVAFSADGRRLLTSIGSLETDPARALATATAGRVVRAAL